MTLKGAVLGLMLALFISVFTYFNDAVIRSTYFIGNYLPLGVFGGVIVLLLVVNPLLRFFNQKWMFRQSELLVAAAIGLAACAWPGSNFYRDAMGIVAMPNHLEKTEVGWQGQNVMSYVPGGSPLLAQGHVSDWQSFAAEIAAADQSGGAAARRVAEKLDPPAMRTFAAAADSPIALPAQIDSMTRSLNQIIESRSFYDQNAFSGVEIRDPAQRLLDEGVDELSSHKVKRLNRSLLVSAFPDLVMPQPEGQGLLLTRDEAGVEVIDSLLAGRPEGEFLSLRQIPWGVWWPSIRLWGGLALMMATATLCLALIVHRQWYNHELLSYPIARFVGEATAWEPGNWLPNIARNKLFWVALLVVVGIRSLNGLAAWFEGVPEFPLDFSYAQLQELFPNARQVERPGDAWRIRLIPAAIGFAYFINSKISFSIGVSDYIFVLIGALFISRGVPFTFNRAGEGEINLFLFGAYLGYALVIFYTGRRYYLQVLSGTFGLSRTRETPAYAVWAARGLLLSFVLAVYLLHTVGLPIFWGVLTLGLMLLAFIVLSRLIAESGMFAAKLCWYPVGVLTALFGIEAIGPTVYVVMALANVMLVSDPRNALMPFLNTGLGMAEDSGPSSTRRLAPVLLAVVIMGFVAAGLTVWYINHNVGINLHDTWANVRVPSMPFDNLARYTAEMNATGVLSETVERSSLEGLSMFSPSEGAYAWVGMGLAIVLLTGLLRLRLPWWPLHPIAFLLWTDLGFVSAFLVGWAIKSTVVKTSGSAGYHSVKPVMVGLIGGDLLAGIVWIAVGVIYYFETGHTPPSYRIFPG